MSYHTECYTIVLDQAEDWPGWQVVKQLHATARRSLDGQMVIMSWCGDEPAEVVAVRDGAMIYTGAEVATLVALLDDDPNWAGAP